ncbi:MAG: hypothetical protein WCO09_04580 [bacterium]
MLYLIYGTNSNKVRTKQKELISIMQSKRPDVLLHKVTAENWNDTILDELLSSQGLFLIKYIVVLDKILDDKEISAAVMGVLNEMKESNHAWIVVEEKITATNLKKFEKFTQKIFNYDKIEGELDKKQRINAFDFAEQFAGKNKVGAWKEFLKLKDAELVGEEIHGVLWWQMKSVYLAKFSKTAEEAGLAPYSFQKALRLSKGWELKELNQILDKLVGIYHEAHKGSGDMMVELEKLTFSL